MSLGFLNTSHFEATFCYRLENPPCSIAKYIDSFRVYYLRSKVRRIFSAAGGQCTMFTSGKNSTGDDSLCFLLGFGKTTGEVTHSLQIYQVYTAYIYPFCKLTWLENWKKKEAWNESRNIAYWRWRFSISICHPCLPDMFCLHFWSHPPYLSPDQTHLAQSRKRPTFLASWLTFNQRRDSCSKGAWG